MQQVKQSFEDRIQEIELYYKLLSNIINREAQLIFPNENNIRENLNVRVTSILKSSANLHLYNLVESTISNCLVEIHSSFTNDTIHYSNLSDEIQKLWINFHYDYFKKTSNERDILNNLKILIDTWVTNTLPVTLTYKEFTKYNTGGNFSGNLDSTHLPHPPVPNLRIKQKVLNLGHGNNDLYKQDTGSPGSHRGEIS